MGATTAVLSWFYAIAVMKPTEDEKQRFLQYIRDGDDRATAAWRINPEFTGTMFRKMCNPRSLRAYDPEFAVAYDAAVDERGPLDPTRQQIWSGLRETNGLTADGFTRASHLTNDQLEQFLDMVRDGIPNFEAARACEPPTSMTQISRRSAKDADFADAFTEAKEEGYNNYQEHLRSEAKRQAFAGDYRALKDQMLMHLPEARALTTSRHEVTGLDGGALRLLAEKHFSDLPPEMLDEMIKTIEAKELGEIGPTPE